MTDDIYVRLRAFLDTLPAGFPETPTGIELKILKKMFTPEQAELTMRLTKNPETIPEIALRTGLEEADLSERLEELAKDGLIFRTREGEKRMYQAFQFVVGLYEFQLNRLDREFCELFEEYMPYVGASMFPYTSQLRVIPVASSLNGSNRVEPYNRVREVIANEELISVTQCICKKEQGIMGNECKKPQEVCLMFGKFARFYIDNNYARQITLEEANKILDLAEESGLVLSPTNTQRLEALCCCCDCCCPTLKNIKIFPNPAELTTSFYRSVIEAEACIGCGECMDICPMNAIKAEDGISMVLEKRCIGCGLCVNRCPVDAITMIEKEKLPEAPLPTLDDVMDRIAAQRGVSH